MLLTPALIAFYNAHPRIHLVVQSGRTFELINQLLDGLIDIAIVHVPFDASDALDCLYMPHEHIMAVAHHHLLPASNQSIPLCQLRDLPLILNKSLRPRIEAACAMLGFIPRIFCSTDDGRTALLWANADLGVAVVSQSVVDVISLGPQMHACPIDGPLMHTQCALLWRKRETYTSELARAFIQTFKQAYQTAPFTK